MEGTEEYGKFFLLAHLCSLMRDGSRRNVEMAGSRRKGKLWNSWRGGNFKDFEKYVISIQSLWFLNSAQTFLEVNACLER